MEGTGESRVSPRARDAQQAAYIPSANRASCPAEVTILRAAGSRHSSLLPYLRCPNAEAEPRCRGKKARARHGQARPCAGGAEGGPPLAPTLQCCPPGGNGQAVTVTSPPLQERGTVGHPPAPMGVPP